MRIEDITQKALTEASNDELYVLRERCVQVFAKNFKGNRRKVAGFLKRDSLFTNYKFLVDEMKSRNLGFMAKTALDRQVFKLGIWKFDVAGLGDICLISNYASIGGKFVQSPRSDDPMEILVKANQDTKEIINKKLQEMASNLYKRLGKEGKITAEEDDNSDKRIPLYDLVLRAKEEMRIEKVDPRAEKSADDILKVVGEGQGTGGDRQGDGGVQICVCLNCKNEIEHDRGTPCTKIDCPECGAKMIGKDDSGVKKTREELFKADAFDIEKLSDAQKKDLEAETEKIRENAKKPEAKEPHEFKAAKWTFPNGHPRCLICGSEMTIGNVCNMPESWYSKFEWDNEEAWAKERKALKEKKVIKSEEAVNPELSQSYFAKMDSWDEGIRKLNEEIMVGLAAGSVLDLGCGTGRLLKMLKDGGRKVLGIDNNDIALGWCNDRDIETLKYNLNDLPLPFKDGEFDNVIAVNVLEFLDNPEGVAKEMERVAKQKVGIVCRQGALDGSMQKHVFAKSEDLTTKLRQDWDCRLFDIEKSFLVEHEKEFTEKPQEDKTEVTKGVTIDQPQKCSYCLSKAEKGYVWGEGQSYIPVCEKHGAKARHQIETISKEKVLKVQDIPIEKSEEFDISKPYPGEHSVRIKPPGAFDPDTFRRTAGGTIYGSKKVPASVGIIWAKVKPEDQPQPQALRFSVNSWTEATAKKWLADNNIKFSLFEPASKEKTKSAFFKFMKKDEALQVVGGIVYEPGSPSDTDTQGDYTNGEEIGAAMRKFMIAYAGNQNKINVMHKGKAYMFPIVESFQPEEDTRKGNNIIKKGAWWMMLKITDNSIWKAIVDGQLNGFSMEGTAKEGKA